MAKIGHIPGGSINSRGDSRPLPSAYHQQMLDLLSAAALIGDYRGQFSDRA
ncbi:MAG: hypothetical protein ACLSHP_00845 [Coprococcus sp.]